MKETKKNFTKENIEEIRSAVSAHTSEDHWTLDQLDTHMAVMWLLHYGEALWGKLENLLKEQAEWQRRDDAGVVDTFEQKLGNYENEEEIHEFTWFYVPTPGEVFPIHYHEKPDEEKKTKEWYFFFIPERRVVIKFCNEGEAHALVNESEDAIYVLSFKVVKM